jgi:hypothetical protein
VNGVLQNSTNGSNGEEIRLKLDGEELQDIFNFVVDDIDDKLAIDKENETHPERQLLRQLPDALRRLDESIEDTEVSILFAGGGSQLPALRSYMTRKLRITETATANGGAEEFDDGDGNPSVSRRAIALDTDATILATARPEEVAKLQLVFGLSAMKDQRLIHTFGNTQKKNVTKFLIVQFCAESGQEIGEKKNELIVWIDGKDYPGSPESVTDETWRHAAFDGDKQAQRRLVEGLETDWRRTVETGLAAGFPAVWRDVVDTAYGRVTIHKQKVVSRKLLGTVAFTGGARVLFLGVRDDFLLPIDVQQKSEEYDPKSDLPSEPSPELRNLVIDAWSASHVI